MATTTNFGWETPDDTDLVKDGALAMRTLGNAIDASLVDLKGGTTGQVLSKNSNTDMDFTWVTSDDANAIQNAIVDAKGDLIAASAADTPARLAVGNNGDTLVADSSASTGLRWQSNFAAGKNAIINGDFRINQRGFSSTTTGGTFIADRFTCQGSGGTVTTSRQTFTPGTAPVSGYEAVNYIRQVTASQSASSDFAQIRHQIEGVRTFAGQTATFSFWAKANTGTPSLAINYLQYFGTGGSPSGSVNSAGSKVTISTSWARYSVTLAIPSISGKTIGTNNDDYLRLNIWTSAGADHNAFTDTLGLQNNTFEIWGWQLEAGNVATAFQTATGTLAGEFAAACRYYYRRTGGGAYQPYGLGYFKSSTAADLFFNLPVTMRTSPTSIEYSTVYVEDAFGTASTGPTLAISNAGRDTVRIGMTGFVGQTAGRSLMAFSNNDTNGYIGLSAEL